MKLRFFKCLPILALLAAGCATIGDKPADPVNILLAETEGGDLQPAQIIKPPKEEIQARVRQELKVLGKGEKPAGPEAKSQSQEKKVSYDIPITINHQVERWIDYFQQKAPSRFRIWLSRSGRYVPLMHKILKQYGLPEDLVFLAMIESGFSCRAYSRAHAVGPWQFIRSTGRRYGLKINYWIDERRDPVKATHAAAKYLKDLYEMFGSWYLAAAGYNAGEMKIKRALKRYRAEDFWEISQHRRRYLRSETKNYVPKLIAAAIIAKEPHKYGFTNIQYQSPLVYDTVEVHPGTSVRVLAKIAGIKRKLLKDLNPELRRWCTPPTGAKYQIKIPSGRKTIFMRQYAKLTLKDRTARVAIIRVKVRSGDTMGKIARTHRVRLQDLRAVNRHLNPRRLRIGQSVVLPPSGGLHRARRYKARAPRVARTYPRPTRTSRKIYHRVRKGDTLWDIAQAYGISHRNIKRWNGKRSNRLAVGQKLVLYVPQAKAEAKREPAHRARLRAASAVGKVRVYTVKKGDNLWTISRRFRTTPARIKRLNKLRSNRIDPGDRLSVRLGG